MMRTFNTTILIVALTFSGAVLPSENRDSSSIIDSALSVPELHFVLRTTQLVVAMFERELYTQNNTPDARSQLRAKLEGYYVDVIRISLEIARRSR